MPMKRYALMMAAKVAAELHGKSTLILVPDIREKAALEELRDDLGVPRDHVFIKIPEKGRKKAKRRVTFGELWIEATRTEISDFQMTVSDIPEDE